jgi:hydroxymethylbilane synthase
MAQASFIAGQFKERNPSVEIEIVNISTSGDQDRSSPLWKLEGTGFFTTQIENALLENKADFAVHSFKDLPTCLGAGLKIAAVCDRKFVEDVLVSKIKISSINELETGARVGTSSLRRIAQVRGLRPDVETVTIRGNIQTRINKVLDGELDAIVIARAGLERLGCADSISFVFDPDIFVPAPAQGALAIECREDDIETAGLLECIDDKTSRITSMTERQFLSVMEGGCHAPVGAIAAIEGEALKLTGFISDLDGKSSIKMVESGTVNDWQGFATRLGEKMLIAGGRKILEELRP